MATIYLRKLNVSDIRYFLKWWRDKDLLRLTSGRLRRISDGKVRKYFLKMINSKADYHFIITLDKKSVGHISLIKKGNNRYETQIIIGEKKYWNKSYGTKAIKMLINKAKKMKIFKIYLEVRPNNIRAIKAYENCGFVRTKNKRYPRNKYLPETVRMELKYSKKNSNKTGNSWKK